MMLLQNSGIMEMDNSSLFLQMIGATFLYIVLAVCFWNVARKSCDAIFICGLLSP